MTALADGVTVTQEGDVYHLSVDGGADEFRVKPADDGPYFVLEHMTGWTTAEAALVDVSHAARALRDSHARRHAPNPPEYAERQ